MSICSARHAFRGPGAVGAVDACRSRSVDAMRRCYERDFYGDTITFSSLSLALSSSVFVKSKSLCLIGDRKVGCRTRPKNAAERD